MLLQIGKSYVTRDGFKTGTLRHGPSMTYSFSDGRRAWTSAGSYLLGARDARDIVAEYVPAPPAPSIVPDTAPTLYVVYSPTTDTLKYTGYSYDHAVAVAPAAAKDQPTAKWHVLKTVALVQIDAVVTAVH